MMSNDDTVEAVENPDVTADVDAENQSPANNTFDLSLATTHSYLGNDLEVLRGRMLLDNGIYLNLPLLFEKSLIFFPEQTLPMVEYSRQIVSLLRSNISKDRTFGVVRSSMKRDVLIGTTAEIYEYSDRDPDGFRIKAKGRQHFKILKVRSTVGGMLADVQILPEIVLGPPFFEERLASLDRLRVIPQTESEARELEYRVTRRDSVVTQWPSWVYRQYDPRRLAMRIHNSLQSVESSKYAWTIASCCGCGFHVGWLFTAVDKDLRPRQFWGLTRKSLILKRQYAVLRDDTDTPGSPNEDREAETSDDFSSDSEGEDHVRSMTLRMIRG